jgi:hypothetical protein
MKKLVVVAAEAPAAEEICELFRAYGFAAEIRGYMEGILAGKPAAIILALFNRALPADRRAAELRQAGYQGVILVLGRISPDLKVRQRLAEQKAWFMPALYGPDDTVMRIRQLLG